MSMNDSRLKDWIALWNREPRLAPRGWHGPKLVDAARAPSPTGLRALLDHQAQVGAAIFWLSERGRLVYVQPGSPMQHILDDLYQACRDELDGNGGWTVEIGGRGPQPTLGGEAVPEGNE